MPDTVSDEWIEERLRDLAQTAWAPRRITPTREFSLNPTALPALVTPVSLEEVVKQFYKHARKWAPGFEVPYSIPKVTISPIIESAGVFRDDADGYLFIDVSPEFASHPEAILAILAHESCHHILSLSGIRGKTRDETEWLTDLAIFICGFGEVFLQGYSSMRQVESRWTRVHIGYLTDSQYGFAHDWVLRSQGLLPASSHAPSASSTGSKERGAGLLRRLLGLFRSKSLTGPVPSSPRLSLNLDPKAPGILVFDAVSHQRKILLTRLMGNKAVLDRLIETERHRQPSANELTLLETVLERLQRDRR